MYLKETKNPLQIELEMQFHILDRPFTGGGTHVTFHKNSSKRGKIMYLKETKNPLQIELEMQFHIDRASKEEALANARTLQIKLNIHLQLTHCNVLPTK